MTCTTPLGDFVKHNTKYVCEACHERGTKKKEIPRRGLKNQCNVMSRLRGQTYMSSLHCLFCSGLGHQHTKGANGSRYQFIYEPTEPSQPIMSDDVNDEDRPQHRELRPLLFSNSVWFPMLYSKPLSVFLLLLNGDDWPTGFCRLCDLLWAFCGYNFPFHSAYLTTSHKCTIFKSLVILCVGTLSSV